MNKDDFSPEAAKAFEPFLKEQALTEMEFWLLYETYMTVAMPAERLIDWTLNEIQEPVDTLLAEAEVALRSLLDRGLLLEIDEPCMSAIQLLLGRSRLVPAAGWPIIGSVDLSLRGAAVMICWRERVFGSLDGLAVRTMQDCSSEIVLGTDGKAVADLIEVCMQTDEDFVEAGEITLCGPWCNRWWDVYPVGFVSQVTMRKRHED